MNLPNILTLVRLGFIPILVAVFYLPGDARLYLTALIFLMAAATDLIDGYIARRRAQITNLGKLLDPVADKLLVMTALILLVESGKLWAWVAILMIGREIAVTGLRAMASSTGIVLQADGMGKLKMFFQVIGITVLFVSGPSEHHALWVIGSVMLAAAVMLAVVSGGQYTLKVGQMFSLPKPQR
jgi:CDP-diacylglycerol--glycerol-3-phosphate 3-phosphatidyltransferase